MNYPACVTFLQGLLRTPSLPGDEAALAGLVAAEMKALEFDDVTVDAAGNVIGLFRGKGNGPSVMLNTHLDHVDAGDLSGWSRPPFGGSIADSRVWGRGAVDIKGPLAAQVHAVGNLIRGGRRPLGDLFVTAVVQEEVGGIGARYLAASLKTDVVIVGEPSRNELRIGHRGRSEFLVRITGKSAHASVPELAVNPLETLASFVLRLKDIERGSDPLLGKSSCAPTLIGTDQTSPNVIPETAWLVVDWRSVPGEDTESVRRRLELLAGSCRMENSEVDVQMRGAFLRTYTGLELPNVTGHPAFQTGREASCVKAAAGILRRAIGLENLAGYWRFATDGGHFHEAGMEVLGFGPGNDALAHTTQESISLDELETGIRGYEALALELGAVLGNRPTNALPGDGTRGDQTLHPPVR